MCPAEALPEAGSAPTWYARFSIGSGNHRRGGAQFRTGPLKQYASPVGYTLLNRNDPSIDSFRDVFFKIRLALGTTAFGINEVRLPAGLEGIEHDEIETGHEEVYIVLDGSGTFTVDGTVIEIGGGDYLRVDAEATRKVVAGSAGLTYVVVAAKPKAEYDGRSSL